MNSQEIEARFKGLEDKVRVLEDLEAIQKLQKAYGYYLEHWMVEELIDLFADNPQTELSLRVGRYLGKEGVKRYFKGEPDRRVIRNSCIRLCSFRELWMWRRMVKLPTAGGMVSARWLYRRVKVFCPE